VAAVVHADDAEALAGDRESRAAEVVAAERLARPRKTPFDQHEPAPDELVGSEAEDEEALIRQELQLRHLCDPGYCRDAECNRLRQERAAEVGDVSLEQAEVRASDMDQLVGAVLDARGE